SLMATLFQIHLLIFGILACSFNMCVSYSFQFGFYGNGFYFGYGPGYGFQGFGYQRGWGRGRDYGYAWNYGNPYGYMPFPYNENYYYGPRSYRYYGPPQYNHPYRGGRYWRY
ncbi:MAG: DUF5320 domain-containing protein, partial [Candidatus Obscuribacterales bacterium]|nr:DUF5320 domain-containing protein [Candidatus Obscuribacterales bacterium]